MTQWQDPHQDQEKTIAGGGNNESAPEWVGCEGGTERRPTSLKPSRWGRGMKGSQVQSIKICGQGKKFEFYLF